MYVQEVMKEGMILGKYREFLLKLYRERQLKITKPLGLCVYCMMFWVNLIVFIWFDYMHFVPSLGLTFIFIELIRKIQK